MDVDPCVFSTVARWRNSILRSGRIGLPEILARNDSISATSFRSLFVIVKFGSHMGSSYRIRAICAPHFPEDPTKRGRDVQETPPFPHRRVASCGKSEAAFQCPVSCWRKVNKESVRELEPQDYEKVILASDSRHPPVFTLPVSESTWTLGMKTPLGGVTTPISLHDIRARR
jgi:hypothetical protein